MDHARLAAAKPTVMISYSHRDATHMRRIKQELTESGFEVLVDEERFSLSYSTKPEMDRLVDTANLLVVLLSPDSVASKPVRHELRRGLDREKVEHRKIVFAAKVRSCSRVIAGWPEDRLWANLYNDYEKAFRRLVQSLRKAAKSVVPLAHTSQTPEELASRAEAFLQGDGMKIYARIVFFSRFGPKLEDDPERRIIAIPTTNPQEVGPCFFLPYRNWTLFFHFPRAKSTLSLTEPLIVAKHLLDAKIAGYLSRPDRKHRDTWLEELVGVARRHRLLMDVVVSPHPIARARYVRQNLALLEWKREKPFLVYHRTSIYSQFHSLPVFFAPKTQTTDDLHTLLRLLKATIRVEVPRLKIMAKQWDFLDPLLQKMRRRFRDKAQRRKSLLTDVVPASSHPTSGK
jgi:hypothetical protein